MVRFWLFRGCFETPGHCVAALGMALALLVVGVPATAGCCDAPRRLGVAPLDEQVVMLAAGSGQLQTTIYKPPGAGSFPLLLMNHGKALGNPHGQARDRFLVLSREFVKRGYAVVIPMRRGFAGSSGEYVEYRCDMFANGQRQADDVRAVLDYLVHQRWVDPARIVVAGQSYGGLAALALAARGYPGVRGVLNFAGGLRLQDADCDWQASLVDAFAAFGQQAAIPSLWFYGANDHHFGPPLAARLHDAYVGAGGNARLVAFGKFKNDAHGMSSSWDGVRIWWPETEKFLRRIGMPTQTVLALDDAPKLAKTDYAGVDDVEAVPYLTAAGRAAYRRFLSKPLPRAFAVAPGGAWSWAEDGDDPQRQALAECTRHSGADCRLYAVNDDVVWSPVAATAAAIATTQEFAGR